VAVNLAIQNGARKSKACDTIGLNIRTLERWEKNIIGDRRSLILKNPVNKLTNTERNCVLQICCSDEYKDMTPNEIVPILAAKGTFIASESTYYRILKAEGLLNHRSDCKPSQKRNKPDELKATGPNQVWSWDITYLLSPIKGMYYYLYMFEDVWSRVVIGWAIHENESAEIASEMMKKICSEKNIKEVKLHSDNGGPMKGATMLATLRNLGVIPSFSRPRVSNDNPYSESLFKTLKYRAGYPKYFSSISDAEMWVAQFVQWYNNEHIHSGIKFVTPMQRHTGEDKIILEKRRITYTIAKNKHPQRWSGSTRNWDWEECVFLNPTKTEDLLTKIAS